MIQNPVEHLRTIEKDAYSNTEKAYITFRKHIILGKHILRTLVLALSLFILIARVPSACVFDYWSWRPNFVSANFLWFNCVVKHLRTLVLSVLNRVIVKHCEYWTQICGVYILNLRIENLYLFLYDNLQAS